MRKLILFGLLVLASSSHTHWRKVDANHAPRPAHSQGWRHHA